MSTPTCRLQTSAAVNTIHKAQALAQNMSIPQDERNRLIQLTDAVVSFTGYYLRYANPKCRPEQATALANLTSMTNQMEKLYGTTHPDTQLAE